MDGILLFNKPILWTSHDAVDFVRRRTGQRAVGHAGTLDPLATGLLVLLLGAATKLSAAFSDYDKEYGGSFWFGVSTDTQDMEGKLVESSKATALTEARVREIFCSLEGEQDQVPPRYSAVKKDGKKLCDWARQGVAVEGGMRRVSVSQFELIRYEEPEAIFSLSCSKGTYVRALADSAGRLAGTGGALSALVRRRVGPYHLSQALTEHILSAMAASEIADRLLKSA